MDLLTMRLLFDFGLLVLIWLVQLVIYPGLCYYAEGDLYKWHPRYTSRVSFVVVPLMAGQLIIAGIQLWKTVGFYSISSLIIIGFLWGLTFIQFVPLHNSIAPDKICSHIPARLVKKNKIRTALWTILFIWTFSRYF